jgi:putative holliday junction resolvase
MRRILGLDVGDKTLGVAVSDELGFTAQGVTVHRRGSLTDDLVFLRDLLARYEGAAIVVGLPKNMDGSLGPQAQKTLAFIERIQQVGTVPVIVWDERLTTQAAERVLLEANTTRRRRKQVRDQLAAQLILQSFLEWRLRHPSAPLPRHDQIRPSSAGFSPEDHATEAEHDEVGQPDAEHQGELPRTTEGDSSQHH